MAARTRTNTAVMPSAAPTPTPTPAPWRTSAPRCAAAANAALARREIRLIQIGRSALQLDDATYRAMLAGLCGGKTSSKVLSTPERQRVLDHMRRCGFVPKPRAGSAAAAAAGSEASWRYAPQMRKLRAMWYALAEAGHVVRPADTEACNAAVLHWAQRRVLPDLQALRFASGAQMVQLVEAMKMWHARVGLPAA